MKLHLARALLITTALVVGFLAVKYALANLNYYRVDRLLGHWQTTQQVDEIELNEALTESRRMLALHGHFPHYLNMTAKVHEWEAFMVGPYSPRYQSALSGALALYKKSSQLRAHWPLTWLFMANIKAQLGQFDDDFYFYISQAINYGPFVYQVNLQVAQWQLHYWGKLPKLSGKVAVEQIKRALLNTKSRNTLLAYAAELNKEAVVCVVAKKYEIEAVLKHKVCREYQAN